MTSERWKRFCEYYSQMWQMHAGRTSLYADTLNNTCFSGVCRVQYVLSFCGDEMLCPTWWDGTGGSQPGDSDWFCRQRILRFTLGPNSMPLEPRINGFQILAFTSASSCSQTHTVPAVQKLKGWILEFSTGRDLITLAHCVIPKLG